MPGLWSRKGLRRAGVSTLILIALGAGAWYESTANFGAVQEGRIYRSGQMRGEQIGTIVHAKGIKTVLNLRGSHPDEAWYRAERAAVLGHGATQVDIALSSCEWMSRAQARTIVQVLDTCEYPVLIHCWRGAERTGLVSAFTVLLRPGGSLDQARAQFSLAYLFLPVGDGALMPHHLDQYEQWLQNQHLSHSPAQFRRWINEGYQPGNPSREAWPYDPYPLVVVTRPEAGRTATRRVAIGR